MLRKVLVLAAIFSVQLCRAQFADIQVSMLNYGKRLHVNEINVMFQDSDGFMWYGTADGLCRDDGYNIHVFRRDIYNRQSMDISPVISIAEDAAGHIWVGTTRGLLLLDRLTFEMSESAIEDLRSSAVRLISSADGTVWVASESHLYHFDSQQQLLHTYDISGEVLTLYEDSRRQLFFSTSDLGLRVKRYDCDDFETIDRTLYVSTMLEDREHGCYWLCEQDRGIIKYTERNGKALLEPQERPLDDDKSEVTFFTHMAQDNRNHYLWLVSYYRGLVVMQVGPDGRLHQLSPQNLLPANNRILNYIYKTRDGRLWVSGFDSGTFVIGHRHQNFTHYPLLALGLHDHVIPTLSDLCRDSGGIFWITQTRNNLKLYDAQTERVVDYVSQPDLRDLPLYLVSQIAPSSRRNSVWVVSNEHEIYLLSREEMTIRCDKCITNESISVEETPVSCVFEDSRGDLWIGTANGLSVYRAAHDQVESICNKLGQVTDIAEAADGTIWCSVARKGLFRIDAQGHKEEFPLDINMLTLAATSGGDIWIGSQEGRVYHFDPSLSPGERYVDYTTDCGASGQKITRIRVDCYDHVWIATDQSLTEFYPPTCSYRQLINVSPMSPMRRFIPASMYVDPSDRLIYLGGTPGFMAITPTHELESTADPVRTFITDVRIGNRSVWFETSAGVRSFSNSSPRNAAPKNAESGENVSNILTFNYSDHNIYIEFSSLDFNNIESVRYAYMLEGVDAEWIELPAGQNTALYNRIPNGTHTFRVKATDSNGLWSDSVAEICIVGTPPWYESTLAYIAYTLLLAAAVILLTLRYKRHLQRDSEKALNENIAQAKLKYFTSISHELLTPLTIISCLTEQLPAGEGENTARLIQANVTRLKRLLQQVLDFRKLDSHNMRLYVERGNISQFLRSICKESFEPLAQKKQLQFMAMLPVSDIEGYFDRDKLEKVVFNLVSNAFKYTPDGKSVTLSAQLTDSGRLQISVRDEGVGIEEREQKFIFNRFYSSRRNDGNISNGIGLSLTKDFVELHHGTISVRSQLGKGSEFLVELPIERSCFSLEELKEEIQDAQILYARDGEVEAIDDSEKENLLMVEDNLELLSVMQGLLAKRYNVFAASNGIDALEIIHREDIQIIVSDIAMPRMDGLELCRHVKQDLATSHLVFVLLTARISAEAQSESYNAGADAYLPKPFETKVLISLLDNLSQQRQKYQKAFRANTLEVEVQSLEVSDLDRDFVQRAVRLVEQNIDSSSLDVNFLASSLNMSRSTFSRKIKALTGQTPFEFIKSIRLKYAHRLLLAGCLVAETMLRVGYTDHRSFTLAFKDQFGMLPSEVLKQR